MYSRYIPKADEKKRPRSFYRDITPPSEQNRIIAKELIVNGTWPRFLANYRKVTGKDKGNGFPTQSEEYNIDFLAKLIVEYKHARILEML
jgi:hypothetical protein